jgi:uncharacterized integral membrane protein
MPWRLIGFILLFVFFLVFIGFNLDHRCDITFFYRLELIQVPVYLTHFSAFVLGMLWAVPYVISFRFKRKPGRDEVKDKGKKKQSPQKDRNTEAGEALPGPGGPYGID